MYQEHFGLTRELFRSNSERESIYVGPQQLATIGRLRKALATPDAIVAVTGPVGVGKSAIAGRALEEIAPERMIARIGRMRLGPDEVLELLLESFSVIRQPAGTIQRFAAFKRLLRDFSAKGTRPFILVEDARRIGTDALLEIEALTAADTAGAAAANIILLGDSELDTVLADPGLARMKQRIRLRHTVTPFTEMDTEGYLRRCVSLAGGDFGSIFASGTVAALHVCSGGIPRVLNNICESVLTEAADCRERPVTAELVSTVASDVYGIEVMPGFAENRADDHDATNSEYNLAIAPEAADAPVDELAERRSASPSQPVGSHQDLPELGELLARIGATRPEADTLAAPDEDLSDTPPETAVAGIPEQAVLDASPIESDAVTNALEPESAEFPNVEPDNDETAVAVPLLEVEAEPVIEPEPYEAMASRHAAVDAVAEAPPVNPDDDMQELVHVTDDDDTLEAAILDEQQIPSIDEVLAAPEQQERDWSISDDDIPVLTADMHVPAANDEENAISLADTPDDLEFAEDVMPDIDELELALSSTNDVIEEPPDVSQDDARPAEELPEITLDNELDKKKAPEPVTNLSRWQKELALANGLEDISDVLAETVFGDKAFEELAAQIAFNPDPERLDGLSLAEESPPAVSVRSATTRPPEAQATTASQQDRSGAWKFDMSVSRRFELVKELGRAQKEREINAHSMVEITLGEDGYPVDASQGPVPEPIETQIDTEITQSRMALKPEDIEKLPAKEEQSPEPEKESRGLFGLFRRSSKS